MKLRMLAAVLLGSGLMTAGLTGCQNTVNTVENSEKSMEKTTVSDKRFVTDGFLRDRLKLQEINTSRTQDGFLRVQLTAMNVRVGAFSQMWSGLTGENPYRIKYKFTWYDQNGMAVDSILSSWEEISVVPGETVHLQSVAPLKNCNDFMINLREAE